MCRLGALSIVFAAFTALAIARHGGSFCGTTAETPNETLFLHRQAMRARAVRGPQMRTAATPSLNRDIGNIAIIEDTDGVVARVNQFNLDAYTLRFIPAANATSYSYTVTPGGYDSAASAAGTPLAALDDDDSRLMPLPFAFPFFGAAYHQVYVNSDGNLTFTASDSASTDRSLGRATSGPPRIFPLFDDLNPAQTAGGVRMLSDATHAVVSWDAVPEYVSFGIGLRQTFQVRLYIDGRIEFSYSGIQASNAVVGIAPGAAKGSSTLVSFHNDPSATYTAAVAERFGDSLVVDAVTAAQKFYLTHDDSYDYLMIFNNMNINAPGAGVIALTNIVRSSGTGYGAVQRDLGQEYGSASRLQAVIDGGPLSQYPKSPTGAGPRAISGDTPLSILSHETGHLFLAFASINDPNDPSVQPMLGYGNVHWSFVYNSEASFLEGERIIDQGSAISPEFLTTDTVQAYSPLDQYLMGFAPAGTVGPSFYVSGVAPFLPTMHPLRNYGFNGTRQNVTVDDVIQTMGRRTPDYTVAQRRFRFGFILVVAQGTEPSAADLAQLDTYRQAFEPYYTQAASNNAFADTALRKSLKLSLFPNAGVAVNTTSTGTVTVQSPPPADLTVKLQAPNGNLKLPDSVKIAAGTTTASFAITGLQTGVEEVQASIDPNYETGYARVQVADKSLLKFVAVAGDRQIASAPGPLPDPVVARLTDVNNLPYRGARIVATASTGGAVDPSQAATDDNGQVSFRWTPGGARTAQLLLSADGVPGVSLTLTAGGAVPVATAVVNAASFTEGMAAGSYQTVVGVNFAGGQTSGVRVLLNGASLPLLYTSDTQINFYVPQEAPLGAATLTVMTPTGGSAAAPVNVVAFAPGIFSNGVLFAGTANAATTVRAGDYLEIYCTGLGPTRDGAGFQRTTVTPVVFLGATPVTPIFSGLAPGYTGLYQVDIQVPAGLAPGPQTLLMSVSLAHSNPVQITVQ